MRECRYTSSDGLRLFYRAFDPLVPGPATGSPVLCLPGLTRHSGDFIGFAKRLSGAGRRVVCPDLRGRGRSEYSADWRTYDPAYYIDDIRGLLAVEQIDRAVIVGTSMGGLLSMAMGAAMPTVLAGLIINDVGPDIAADGQARILDYISVDRPQPDWASAARHLRQLLPNLSVSDEAGWIRVARNTYREGPDGLLHFDWDVSLHRAVRRGVDPNIDLWALWRSVVHLPILVVRGGVSDVLSSATFARMKETKRDLAQVELPGVGHTPSLEEPASTEAIDDFFRRHQI
ncbi:MAG: alpha/beta hydrolase [Rhodospirillales bacterium]|nr:alpha/beta hydrolase [Rhodospirillales bacterium]